MNKNKKLIIALACVSVVAVAALSTLSVLLVKSENRYKQSQNIIQNFYQENLYQMSESVSNIEVNMSKLLVSTNNLETAVLLNDTYRHSQAAIVALNNLPIPMHERKATDRFLNQLGDWCDVKSREMLSSESNYAIEADGKVEAYAIKGEENASAKGKNSKESGEVNSITDFDGQIEALLSRSKSLNRAVKKAAENNSGTLTLPHLSDDIDKINLNTQGAKNSTEVPEIIYDGPFSDGAKTKIYKCLNHKQSLTESEARLKAAEVFKFVSLSNLSLIGKPTNPDSYAFLGESDGGQMYVAVTKDGGFILSASVPCDNSGKTNSVTREQATKKAIEYASLCGYKSLNAVWYTSADGFAVVNLAPITDDVVIYPDLVKVKVCLVNGDFKGIEARGYCACHTTRDLTASITKEEAQRAVSPKLNVKNVRLAVVPKYMTEKLCYEFNADYNGLDYFVYIDAKTGNQFDIMRVIDSEQGEMVM